MLKNYIKIALKVLLRRKLFTFISLFGISFTILILMVAISYLDSMISPKGPEVKQSRTLFAERLTYQKGESKGVSIRPPGYNFLNKYVATLKTPEMVSIFSRGIYNTYKDNRKFFFNFKCADQNFWQIFEFDFIDGKPFSRKDCDNSERVAVISKSTAIDYFGTADVIGKEIDIRSKMFRVIGIVADVPLANEHTYADIWIPISFSDDYSTKENYDGLCSAAILAYSEDDLFKIKQEFHTHLQSALINIPGYVDKSSLKCPLKTRIDVLAEKVIAENDDMDMGVGSGSTADKVYNKTGEVLKSYKALSIIIGIMFLFMLLPALNLVNINLSRIIERSSEIGVRKAFGASQSALVKQFIVENMVLTFIGGVLSFVLTFITFSIINKSGLIINTNLTINIRVFISSLAVCLLFGFIAGVFPAFKMSKLNPVESLRGGE